jgi:hypothetical protein
MHDLRGINDWISRCRGRIFEDLFFPHYDVILCIYKAKSYLFVLYNKTKKNELTGKWLTFYPPRTFGIQKNRNFTNTAGKWSIQIREGYWLTEVSDVLWLAAQNKVLSHVIPCICVLIVHGSRPMKALELWTLLCNNKGCLVESGS